MKKLGIILGVVLSIAGVARAEPPAFVYATLDYEHVIQQSKAFADVEKKIEEKRKSFFSEAQKKEKALTKHREELEKKCLTAPKEECESGMRANTEEFHLLNNTYRSQRSALNESFAKATAKIEESLAAIIQENVQRNKYTVVFHKRMLIYSEVSNDITEEVLRSLNKKLPIVDVQFE